VSFHFPFAQFHPQFPFSNNLLESFFDPQIESKDRRLSFLSFIISFSSRIRMSSESTLDNEKNEVKAGSSALGLDRTSWASMVRRDFGGFDREIDRLVALVWTSLFDSEGFARMGLTPAKGCLLVGQPGCGKSAMAQSLARHSGLPYSVLSGPEVFQRNQGESETMLQGVFEGLSKKGDSTLLIIDEIDILAGRCDEERPIETRLTNHLISLIDGLFAVSPRQLDRLLVPSGESVAAGKGLGAMSASIVNKVFVIGLTNRPEQLDPALTRSGRLDTAITLSTKTAAERAAILEICARGLPLRGAVGRTRQDILKRLASLTAGYVGADLLNLCRETALIAVTRSAGGQTGEAVTEEDFLAALCRARPAVLRDSESAAVVEPPPSLDTDGRSSGFESLGGLADVIRELRASVLLPFERPDLFRRLGITPPAGILIAGPPGTGKTKLASALASATSFNSVFLDPGQIRSKVVGESEAALARVFRQARDASPCFLVIDQLELIGKLSLRVQVVTF